MVFNCTQCGTCQSYANTKYLISAYCYRFYKTAMSSTFAGNVMSK